MGGFHGVLCDMGKLLVSMCCFLYCHLKDSGIFSKCPQIYIKLTGFKDNDSGKLPVK